MCGKFFFGCFLTGWRIISNHIYIYMYMYMLYIYILSYLPCALVVGFFCENKISKKSHRDLWLNTRDYCYCKLLIHTSHWHNAFVGHVVPKDCTPKYTYIYRFIWIYILVGLWSLYSKIHRCMYMYIFMYRYTYIYTHVYIYIYMYTYIHTYVYIYICIDIYEYMYLLFRCHLAQT